MSEAKKRRVDTSDGQAGTGRNCFVTPGYVKRMRRHRNALRLELIAKILTDAAVKYKQAQAQQRRFYLTVNGNTHLTGYSHITGE